MLIQSLIAATFFLANQAVTPHNDPTLINKEMHGEHGLQDPTEAPKEILEQQNTTRKAAKGDYQSAFKDPASKSSVDEKSKAKQPKTSKKVEAKDNYVPTAEANAVIAYADHLFLDGDWYRAISEYRRYLYAVKGKGSEASRAALAIGEALMRGEQWDAAGRQLDGVAVRTKHADVRYTAIFGAARSYLLDGRSELAKPRFRLIMEAKDAPQKLRDEAEWLLYWGHFDAGELPAASAGFKKMSEKTSLHQEDALGTFELLDKEKELPTKNLLLAAGLSLIPGAGHMYLGEWTVGLTSLGINVLLITTAALSWYNGEWGPAIVLSGLEFSWYSGAIFGALSGAYRYNRDAVRNWRDQIISEYGTSRELPAMEDFSEERVAPGTLPRFGA